MQRRAAKIYLFFFRLFHIIHRVFDNYLMYFQNKAYMEAIKFSELPTGDRMPLADEDGVPIIANQENRLLTWGRLKKQLAEQTHTDEVKPNDTKVPTSSAVENRIAATEDDFNDKLTPITAKLGTHDTAIETATATANTAKTTAESASATASEAKTTAEGAASSIGAVSQRVGAIETKIENGEFDAPEVDLSPIAERLSAVETVATTAQTTADTAKAAAIVENLSAHKLVYAKGTGENADVFTLDSATEDLANATLASLVTRYNANFQSLATYIENHPAGLDEVITISKGISLNDNLLDEDGNYIGLTSLGETSHYSLLENCPFTLEIAINRLFYNQKIMFKIIEYQLKELAVRKNDVDTVVKNINSVFAQVMN